MDTENKDQPKCPFHNPSIKTDIIEDDHAIFAYKLGPSSVISPKVAEVKRKWMDDTPDSFANRCLPLLAANGLGWQFAVPNGFCAQWDGSSKPECINIEFFDGSDLSTNDWVQSHFGSGVLTFHIGYLIKTSKGDGLYVKGPANSFKHGVTALEGFVETDWLPFTFTMNWKFFIPNKKVFFEKGDIFCQIFPYPKEYIEKFNPVLVDWDQSGEVGSVYDEWSESRDDHNRNLKDHGIAFTTGKDDWQKNYFKGEYKDGTKCENLGFTHYSKWKIEKFKDENK